MSVTIPSGVQPTFTAPTQTSIVTGVCAASGGITAGNLVYFDNTYSSTGGYQVAQAGMNQIIATLIGVAMNSASLGQPVDIAYAGDINVLSSLSLSVYAGLWLSATAGKAETTATSTTGYYSSFLGIYVGSNLIRLAITPNNGVTN